MIWWRVFSLGWFITVGLRSKSFHLICTLFLRIKQLEESIRSEIEVQGRLQGRLGASQAQEDSLKKHVERLEQELGAANAKLATQKAALEEGRNALAAKNEK